MITPKLKRNAADTNKGNAASLFFMNSGMMNTAEAISNGMMIPAGASGHTTLNRNEKRTAMIRQPSIIRMEGFIFIENDDSITPSLPQEAFLQARCLFPSFFSCKPFAFCVFAISLRSNILVFLGSSLRSLSAISLSCSRNRLVISCGDEISAT